MMDKEVLKKILTKGVDTTQYLLLSYLNVNVPIEDLIVNAKVVGQMTLMVKKGLIEKLGNVFKITDKGRKEIVLDGVEAEVLEMKDRIDWREELFKQVEEVIKKHTGKTTIVNPSGKNLKPSLTVFKSRLDDFFKKFGDQDIEKVKKAILNYTSAACTKDKVKYPVALIYFIWNEKNRSINSELLEWMEDCEETEEVFDGVNI